MAHYLVADVSAAAPFMDVHRFIKEPSFVGLVQAHLKQSWRIFAEILDRHTKNVKCIILYNKPKRSGECKRIDWGEFH